MPLYSCQRCGWATASSWRDAVEGHGEGCPECPGSVALVPLAGRPQDNIAAVDRVGRPFEMRDSDALDGAVRVSLMGGLDIVVADRLTDHLTILRGTGKPVHLDLSELEFIDCTGLEAIIGELTEARAAGRSLEVDRPVSAPVKRVITFLDAASVLWPSESEVPRPALRVIDGAAEAPGESPPGPPDPRAPAAPHAFGVVAEGSVDARSRPPSATITPER